MSLAWISTRPQFPGPQVPFRNIGPVYEILLTTQAASTIVWLSYSFCLLTTSEFQVWKLRIPVARSESACSIYYNQVLANRRWILSQEIYQPYHLFLFVNLHICWSSKHSSDSQNYFQKCPFFYISLPKFWELIHRFRVFLKVTTFIPFPRGLKFPEVLSEWKAPSSECCCASYVKWWVLV